jgi:hypothetical protein
VSYWILTMPALWYAGQGELGIVPLADAVWKYVVAAAAAGGLAALLAPLAPWMAAAPALTASLARIATIAVVFGALYLGAVIVLHRGYAPLAHVAGLVRVMLAPRPARDFV